MLFLRYDSTKLLSFGQGETSADILAQITEKLRRLSKLFCNEGKNSLVEKKVLEILST